MTDKKIGIKRYLSEIISVAVILAILLTVLIPTLSNSFVNGAEKKCEKNLYLLQKTFEKAITADDADIPKWNEIINNKNSHEFIDALKETMKSSDAERIDSKNYYAKYRDGKIYFYCIKHNDIEDEFSVKLLNSFNTAKLDEIIKSDIADYIQVTGFRTYMENESINPDKPDQMKFTKEDDLKKIFPDMSVYLINIGGQKRLLNKDEYEISTTGFDMSQSGTKSIKIIYKTENMWNKTLYADFSFEVMKKVTGAPLEIKFGNGETYQLAAWDWSDYVKEANETNGESKSFDASIVCYEGKYYYYPDGFVIDKRRDNSNPKTSAASIDDPMIAAYNIEFKTDIQISSKENEEEMKKVQDGAIMLEEEKVYIWQSEPSKELDSGWIRVFCELKKLQ